MTREYTSWGWRDGDKASHWGVALDLMKPTTGVVDVGAVEWIHDEICNGIDLSWEEHLEECKGQCDDCHCNHDGGCMCYGGKAEGKAHKYKPCEGEHEHCGPQEQGTVLIGSWKLDPETDKYEPDETGEYAAIVGEIYAQVVWSKTVVRVSSLCSPCYPGQADLDHDKLVTEGGFLCYDFPADMYDDNE